MSRSSSSVVRLPPGLAKGIPPRRRNALRSGVLTAFSQVAVSGSAALIGVLLAREVGRGAETDGFFAAYGVYLVLTLAASALRVVVLPSLARAREEGQLARETLAYAVATAPVAVPAVVVALGAGEWAAGQLTADEVARTTAASTLGWLVPAAVAQLYAGLAASALAAIDDYGTAAVGFAAGAVAGLALVAWRITNDGVSALSWGLALSAVIALVVPIVALAARARGGGSVAGGGPTASWSRLAELVRGASFPLALQALYVIALAAAAALGAGSQTSLGYAYLAAAFFVGVTASSLALVTSVPLARSGIDGTLAARHVVATSWLALAVAAAAAGVFALAGEPLVRAALGSAYRGETGAELGRLVAYLAPWMAATIGVSVAFPLLFVARRARRLGAISLGGVLVHVPLTLAARELLGLPGIAAALAVTTTLFLVALLVLLGDGALRATARGLATPVLVCGALALACFGVSELALNGVAAAVAGAGAYAAILSAWRPRGLRDAWTYVRGLA